MNTLKDIDDRIYLLENTKRFKKRDLSEMNEEIEFLKLEREALILSNNKELLTNDGNLQDTIEFQVNEIKEIVKSKGRPKKKDVETEVDL